MTITQIFTGTIIMFGLFFAMGFIGLICVTIDKVLHWRLPILGIGLPGSRGKAASRPYKRPARQPYQTARYRNRPTAYKRYY